MWMARKTTKLRGPGAFGGRRGRGPSCGRTRVRLWTSRASGPIHRRTPEDPHTDVDGSLVRLQESVQDAGELLVALAHPLDLADGVDDRGVVLAAEGRSDRRQRFVGEALAHVHRDLPRERDVLGVVARLELD